MRLTKKLRRAVHRYLDLQSRRIHPAGHTDSGGRWYPTDRLPCCEFIRTPSRAWPWGLAHHCRTAIHVAYETGYDVTILRQAIKKMESNDN